MEKLIENISRYLESRIELTKIDVQQKIAAAMVSAVEIGLIFFTVLFTIIFASLALANFLNSVIGNNFAGDLIVAGFYLLLCGIAIASRKAIQAKAIKITDNMFSGKQDANADKEVEVVVDNPVAVDNRTMAEERPIIVDNRPTADVNSNNGVNIPGSSSTT